MKALDRDLHETLPIGPEEGQDIYKGEMNIFIETDQPAETFADAATALRKGLVWGNLRAAYREALGGPYEILWPEGLQKFSVKLVVAFNPPGQRDFRRQRGGHGIPARRVIFPSFLWGIFLECRA